MIEKLLFSHLKTNVTSVSNRVYPMVMPQGCIKPALVYMVVNDADKRGATGCDIGADVRFQIDVWASSYAEMKTITREVKSSLKTLTYPRRLNSRDDFDKETGLFRQIIDFTYRSKS